QGGCDGDHGDRWYGEMHSKGGVVVLWFVDMEMVGPKRAGGGVVMGMMMVDPDWWRRLAGNRQ
nr:hypothetical protein [Tanacetum cinerariifolium]